MESSSKKVAENYQDYIYARLKTLDIHTISLEYDIAQDIATLRFSDPKTGIEYAKKIPYTLIMEFELKTTTIEVPPLYDTYFDM